MRALCLSDDNLHGYFIAPRSFRVALLPSSYCIYFEHIVACVADLDAMSGDGSAEDQSHNIVVQTAMLEVGDVKPFIMLAFSNEVLKMHHRHTICAKHLQRRPDSQTA